MKVSELLVRKENWIQGDNAVDEAGESTNIDSPSACAWCLEGALSRCYPDDDDYNEAYKKLLRVISQPRGLVHWNDQPGRTFRQVKAAVEAAGV